MPPNTSFQSTAGPALYSQSRLLSLGLCAQSFSSQRLLRCRFLPEVPLESGFGGYVVSPGRMGNRAILRERTALSMKRRLSNTRLLELEIGTCSVGR